MAVGMVGQAVLDKFARHMLAVVAVVVGLPLVPV
jgi:hypothetical protein